VQKKKVRNYGVNKKAFDFILSHYRKLSCVSPMRDSVHNVGSVRSGKSENSKPSSDFKCDVELAVSLVVPSTKLVRFYAAYASWSDDYIQQEQIADKLLGGARHSYEQRLGELFIRKGLYKGKK
jgi:hypothetical protein